MLKYVRTGGAAQKNGYEKGHPQREAASIFRPRQKKMSVPCVICYYLTTCCFAVPANAFKKSQDETLLEDRKKSYLTGFRCSSYLLGTECQLVAQSSASLCQRQRVSFFPYFSVGTRYRNSRKYRGLFMQICVLFQASDLSLNVGESESSMEEESIF